MIVFLWFFFFQAEDGIRDWSVTGVQTCALPISARSTSWRTSARSPAGYTARCTAPGTPVRKALAAHMTSREGDHRGDEPVGISCRRPLRPSRWRPSSTPLWDGPHRVLACERSPAGGPPL